MDRKNAAHTLRLGFGWLAGEAQHTRKATSSWSELTGWIVTMTPARRIYIAELAPTAEYDGVSGHRRVRGNHITLVPSTRFASELLATGSQNMEVPPPPGVKLND